MLKHVQVSPHRNRSDSLSLRSSISCASSLCGSPEPPSDIIRTPSRASSYCSLNETAPQTTIKVYTACLRLDIEYKTLGIQWETSSKDVVAQLLRRCKMRQRDPRLFYLTMEVTVRKAGVRTVLVLEDEARPAILQACHPKGDSRFCLQIKPGGLIRVHTSVLQPTSMYKSLVISEETTSDELLTLLLGCYNSNEPVEQFCLYEVCPNQEYQRKLHPDDLPLRAQQLRVQKGEQCHFLVRKNPHYPRRRSLLPAINKIKPQLPSNISQKDQHNQSCKATDCQECCTNINRINNAIKKDAPNAVNSTNPFDSLLRSHNIKGEICKMCENSFRSCEFCNKNVINKLSTRQLPPRLPATSNFTTTTTYSPVYSIREIRTVCHSFSSLAVDRKALDIERSNKTVSLPNSYLNDNNNSNCNHNSLNNTINSGSIVQEAVNNNPSKGYGSYVYI